MAQESNAVMYERTHADRIVQNGKTVKKEPIAVVQNRRADLIYSPTYLLFKSPQGVDTVFLSSIKKTFRHFPYKKLFYVSYNNDADFITLLFCDRKNAKNFKKFLRKNGGRYKRNIAAAIIYVPLTVVWPLGAYTTLLGLDPLPPWYYFPKECKQ